MAQPERSDSLVPRQGGGDGHHDRLVRRDALDSRVRLDLWKAVWEASQVMSYDEIRRHVEATISEIVSDEP